MANSKTNIYPVQLQGAELNLNKFDAEIKQYSGFNKNNSPFVGGCLANVFNKDVTIEGSNSKNTYIAPNGDVYKVDTTGLYKNGNKVLDVDATKLYDIEEAEGLEGYDIVALFDEKCFVYCKIGNEDASKPFYFFMRFYDPNIEAFREELILKDYYYSHYFFDCKYVNCGNGLYTWVCSYNENGPNGASRYYSYYTNFIFASYKDGDVVKYGKKTEEIDNPTFFDANAILIKSRTVHALYNNDSEKLYIFVFQNIVSTSEIPLLYRYEVSFNTTGSSITFTINRNSYRFGNSDYFDVSELSGTLNVNSDRFYYYFTQNKIWLCKFAGSEANYIYSCYYRIEPDAVNGWKFVFYDDYSISNDNVLYIKRLISFPFGNLTTLKTSTTSYAKGFCDFETIGVGYDENENLKFTTGCILSKMVLLNNEEVTGITLPDTQRILVTDWNSIAENKVFVPNIESGYEYCCDGQIQCFYKDKGGKYYKLKKVDYVFLSVVNNQIVLNCDTFYNAYRITDGMQLLYGPSWNNRLYVRNGVVRNTEITVNKYYYASAMNEYDLQNNASLLLNPAPIVNEPNSSDYRVFYNNEDLNYKLSYLVNVYSGATVPECKYFGSVMNNDFSRMIKILPLEDLPFPIDTNGNVMYSPCIFSEIKSSFGNNLLIKNGSTFYPLAIGNDSKPVMSFYLASGIEGLETAFIIQGQYYGVINNQIYSLSFNNGVIGAVLFIVNVQGLQFVGNTPYEVLFYSKTNRCLYSFTGANVLTQRQLIDKISEVRNYLYNPATQTVFLITDIGVFFYGIFGQFLLEYTDITDIFLLDNGIVMGTDAGLYHYIKYYLDEGDEGYQKNNIELETCFYGMNNEMVTINDCLYFRLFSEEHEEGNLKVSATTISLRGRKTEETTFRIKASDWDKITHSIYLRYQPKEQRGLGVSFSIDSPFKIASLSVGSQPEAVLVDKVSKGAITAPQRTSNNVNW